MNEMRSIVHKQENEINCLRDRIQVLHQEIKCVKKKIENLKMWMMGLMGGVIITLLAHFIT